jgi:NhaP-type Na+/H+ or K+/H+ antiporter
MEGGRAAFTLALALAAGIVAQSTARHLRVPGIVLLLLAGAGLGPDGLGWVQPRDLGDGLFMAVDLAVAVILFEGGLNLEIKRLRLEQDAIRRLVTLGAAITMIGGAAAVGVFFGWPWRRALLFGSLVVVTGPTVVGPLVRELRLRPRVASLLEAEGVLIDPIGAILAVLMLEIAIASGSLQSQGTYLLLRLGFGALAGVVSGFAIAGLLRVRRLLPEGHENIFVLAAVLLLFESCEEVVSHSGLLAVTLAGVVVGNLRTPVDRDLREFKDQLTVLLIGLLFVLLAADVRLDDVLALGWPGLAVVAALVVVVRPATVWLSTIGTDLTTNERRFVAWVAPRGIVAAAVASVFALDLAEAGLAEARLLAPLTFLVILGTAVFYGLSAAPVGRWLGLTEGRPQGALVVGADAPARALAAALQENGFRVALVDTNREHVLAARLGGLNAHHGSIVSEDIKDELDLAGIGRLIALTPNDEVNALAALHFRDVFDRAEVYQLWPRAEEKGRRGALAGHLRGRVLFGPRVTHDSLEARIAGGAVVKTTTFTDSFGIDAYRAHYGDSALPMFVVTETGVLAVVTAEDQPRPRRGQKLMSLVTPRPAAATPEPSPGSEPAVSPPA